MDKPVLGTLKNVIISNITATGAESACPVAGIPGHHIENVMFENIMITYKGGGSSTMTMPEVPELIDKYPSATMFRDLPAYGFFLRHVTNIKMEDIRLALSTDDQRYVLFADDCEQMEISTLHSPLIGESGAAIIHLNNVRDGVIRNCHPPHGTSLFISVSGVESRDITLLQNNFRNVKEIFIKSAEVVENVIGLQDNY